LKDYSSIISIIESNANILPIDEVDALLF